MFENDVKSLKFSFMNGYEVVPPRRGTPQSAGMDIYLPNFNYIFVNEFKIMNPDMNFLNTLNTKITLPPGNRTLLPTGIKLSIPKGTYVDVGTKSGTFKSTGLKTGSHIVDSDYQGQVYISLFNTGTSDVELFGGKAIAQLIHKPCIIKSWVQVPEEVLFEELTERGSGGFGSTDVKEAPPIKKKQRVEGIDMSDDWGESEDGTDWASQRII